MYRAINRLKEQIEHVEAVNAICSPSLKCTVPTMRSRLAANGYEWAKEFGVLEPYKDALGITMGRPENAWDEKWDQIFTR